MEVLTPDVDKGSQVEGRWCLENNTNIYSESCFQFSSVTQLCLILCDPVDCSMPGLPVHHQPWSLLKLMSIELVMPSNHLILCHPLFLLPSIFPNVRIFPVSQFFTSGGQSIGAPASTSFLPVNIQDWFILGLTGWISFQSKGLSRVFSNTTVQSINSSAFSFLYHPTLTSVHDYWKNHSLD